MKKFYVFCLSFLLLFNFTGCKKKDNLDSISANLTTYYLDINLDTDKKTAKVKQTVDYINNTNSILKTLKFHLYPQFFEEGHTNTVVTPTRLNQAYPNGISFANFEIDRLTINDIDLTPTYEGSADNILSINLDSSLLPNKRIQIELYFSFILPNCEHRFGYGENTINLANFYPIACVYENQNFITNPYNSNGEPFYSDIANYEVNITLNKEYLVASSGQKLNEIVSDNTKTIKLQSKATRDFALVVSNKFKVISNKANDTIVEYYYIEDENASKSLQAGVDSIKTFSKLFGVFPYKNYAIAETDFVYGGMEYPNLVMISDDIDNIDDYLNVIIHETAHQWWYAMVGNDEFLYPWLDEAITEFSTILFYDYNTGYNLNHQKMVEINHTNYTTFLTVYNDVLGHIDTSMRAVNEYETEPEYTYCTYVKGVLMYESLYQLVGEKAFLKGAKLYFENNKFKNAIPQDLISAFENTSKKELNNFFDSWLKGKVVIR